MATQTQQLTETFRFKFSPEFLKNIKDFSVKHKFDNTEDFKINWDIWLKSNNEIITREKNYLDQMGYKGNINDKMYKSARYYFKNKSTEKTKPKKRRQYVGLNRDVLDSMDEHIEKIFEQKLKPAIAYNNFMEDNTYKHLVENEMTRLKNQEFSREDVRDKLKKTYKNRYFIKKKKN